MKLPDRVRDYWPLLVVVFLFCAVWFYHDWQHWLSYATGSYNCPKAGCPGGSAHNYNFWSGSGSDIGEYVVATSVTANFLVLWKSHTCHAHWWCWRHAAYDLPGTDYKLCHVHHPSDDKVSVRDAIDQYVENQAAA